MKNLCAPLPTAPPADPLITGCWLIAGLLTAALAWISYLCCASIPCH